MHTNGPKRWRSIHNEMLEERHLSCQLADFPRKPVDFTFGVQALPLLYIIEMQRCREFSETDA